MTLPSNLKDNIQIQPGLKAKLSLIFMGFLKENIKSMNTKDNLKATKTLKTTIDLISKKTTLHVQHTFFLISKKTTLHVQQFFFVHFLTVVLHVPETSFSFLFTRFMEKMFVSLSLPLLFHISSRQHFSFSNRRYIISMFFFQRNQSPLLFISRS